MTGRLTPSDRASLIADQYLVALEFEMRYRNRQRKPQVEPTWRNLLKMWLDAAILAAVILAAIALVTRLA